MNTHMSSLIPHILFMLVKTMTVKIKHDLFKTQINILRLLLLAFKLREQFLPSFFVPILSQINLKMKTSLHSFLLRQLCILVTLRRLTTPDCPVLSDPGAGCGFTSSVSTETNARLFD